MRLLVAACLLSVVVVGCAALDASVCGHWAQDSDEWLLSGAIDRSRGGEVLGAAPVPVAGARDPEPDPKHRFIGRAGKTLVYAALAWKIAHLLV